jgi:hypothetical protein
MAAPGQAENTDRWARELAEAMEDRQRRLGEHTAETLPLWARQGLGGVPADSLARLEWEQRAAVVTAYREMWGCSHPGDPIGACPGQHNPDARAMWQAAADALTRRDGIDLSPLSEGQPWARRAAFERETSWAPPCPAAELQTARKAERDARIAALRAGREAAVAETDQLRDTHGTLAAAHRLIQERSREYADRLSAVAGTYAEWEAVTEATRRNALAADAELRRRHPIPGSSACRARPGSATGARPIRPGHPGSRTPCAGSASPRPPRPRRSGSSPVHGSSAATARCAS